MHQGHPVKNVVGTNHAAEPTVKRWSVVTPLLMMAGSLFPSEQLQGQKPGRPQESSSTTALVDQERKAAARAEQRTWERKFASGIPTKQLTTQSLTPQIERLSRLTSSNSVSESSLSFLVSRSSNGETSMILPRLETVAKYSPLSVEEIKKKVFDFLQATETLRRDQAEITGTAFDIELMTRSRLILDAERLVEKRDESRKELQSHDERLGKMAKTVEYLRELKALLQEKNPSPSPRVKELSRLLGLKELIEVKEQLELMEPLIHRHRQASKERAADLDAVTERIQSFEDRAELERCENFDTIVSFEKILDKQLAAAKANAAKYEAASMTTVGDLIDRNKATELQRDITKAEAKLLWHSGTLVSSLGNPVAQMVVALNSDGETTLYVAANDPTIRITAEMIGDRPSLKLNSGVPLTCHSLDADSTVAQFLEGNTEAVFKDSSTTDTFPNFATGRIRNIELFLAPDTTFDMRALSSWSGQVTVHGAGKIMLGERAKDAPYQNLRLEQGSQVTISVPKPTPPLAHNNVNDSSLLITVIGFQATLVMPTGDGDTRVDIEVRGSSGEVTVPLLRKGEPVSDSSEIVKKLNSVK